MVGMNHTEQRSIGKIYNPFTCFDPKFNVFNENNELKYIISGDCCQCGIICTCYGRCYETIFNIYDAKNSNTDPSQSLGKIIRRIPGAIKIFFSDADNYDIIFPPNATAYEKLMIIGTTLMIDYTFFEEEPDNCRSYY
jgi:hypothetical protein